MKQVSESKPHLKAKHHPKKKHKSVKVIPLETTPLEDLSVGGEPLDFVDHHFQSELEYDGYQNIEDYDNHAYYAEVDGKIDPEKELDFEERESKKDDEEEDLIDPQENYPLP